jgi:flagellar biosynthesis GTPase FlhF
MDKPLSNEFGSLQEGLEWIISYELSLKQFHGTHEEEKWSIDLVVDEEKEQANLAAIAEKARLAEEERLKAAEAREAMLAEQKEMARHREELAKQKMEAEAERKRLEQEKVKAETESKRLEQERIEAEAFARRNEAEKLRLEEESKKFEEEKKKLSKPKPEKPESVYFFEDSGIGPVYVGQSVNLEHRLYSHIQGAIKQSSFTHWLVNKILLHEPIVVRHALFPSRRIATIMERRLIRRFTKLGYNLFNDEPVSIGANEIVAYIQKVEIDTKLLIEEGFVDGNIVEDVGSLI